MKGSHYSALGCDLTDTARLERLLKDHIDISKCMILCTAEVSMTYMETEAADALLEWAAQYDDSRRKDNAIVDLRTPQF